MVLVKFTSVILLFCLIENSTEINDNGIYSSHISAVLEYLNSNPNRIYGFKNGVLVNARRKANVVELIVNVDVSCLRNSQYVEVPCSESQQICSGFVEENQLENSYKVLTDVRCSPKEAENVKLTNEDVSSKENSEFVTAKAATGPCLGCPFDLNTNVDGVSELTENALRHVESERNQRHALIRILRLQRQVVAGIKYILLIEVAPTVCHKGTDISSTNCPIDESSSTFVCEIVFLQRPWINNSKNVIKNNCTVNQEYNTNLEQNQNRNENEVNINFDIKVNQDNPANEMNPADLADLESQILPLDSTTKNPVAENKSEHTNGQLAEPVASYDQDSENLDKGTSTRPLLEGGTGDHTSTSETSKLEKEAYSDIELNKVKRSVNYVEDNVQGHDNLNNENNKLTRRKRGLVGGPSPLDLNNSKIIQFTKDALTGLDSSSEQSNRYKVVDIISATSQVVAGVKYNITAKISLTNCPKDSSTSLEDCEFQQNADTKICNIIIWDRPWLNKKQFTLKCDDNKIYTFENPHAINKRSVSANYIGGKRELIEDTVSLQEVNPRIKKLIQSGLEHLDSKSNYETKYMVKNIRKVSKQIVSGQLWLISVEIILSDCPKLYQIRICEELEDSEPKVCQFKIWEQPWLTTGTKISIFCENDKTPYSFSFIQKEDTKYDKHLSMFQDFMSKHNKTYSNEIEFNHRLKVFEDNLNTIKLLNMYEQGSAKYGITQFADLTRKEFSTSHGLRVDLRNENDLPFMAAAIPNIELPTEFDWRKKGAVTKVKNQGSCGSCWAFSTTGNVEGQYAIKHGKLLMFSEQELVDCDKRDDGCDGGLMDNAYRSIEEIGGLESESDYPYDGDDEKCHFNKSQVEVQISGALNISHNETDMAKWLVQHGPIAIAINANAMQFYVGGVSHPWKMLCSPNSLDHGVLIVGYGVHNYTLFNKSLPYWTIKNSWGSSWGEQGYYRVYRGDGTCGVNQTPSSAIVV